jgi:hypothetical protein
MHRRTDRGHLLEDVRAIAFLFDHPLHAPHLAFDAFQASRKVCLDIGRLQLHVSLD